MTLLDQLPHRAGLDLIWHVLPQARLVGGSVRDLLLGDQAVHDLDLATPDPPETVQALLEAAGVKTIPTGLTHGTITALIDRTPFEITTLRRDVSTNGRHAEVAWTTDWQEDAARRDFTINALFCDRFGVIHDYFDGQRDLAVRHVRFVGKAAQRIEEDALRILRFFRFEARFGGEHPDDEAMQAIRAQADLIGGLSAERIASEMLRILIGPHLLRTLSHMEAAGILSRIIASPQPDRLARVLDDGLPEDDILRLGLLSDAPELAARLRLSGKQAQRLARMNPMSHMPISSAAPFNGAEACDRPEANGGELTALMPALGSLSPLLDDGGLRLLLSSHDKQSLIDQTWHAQATDQNFSSSDWAALRQRLEIMQSPVFPLAGRDVLAAGVPAGPEVGRILAALACWWRKQGCLPDHTACLAELKTRLPLSPYDVER